MKKHIAIQVFLFVLLCIASSFMVSSNIEMSQKTTRSDFTPILNDSIRFDSIIGKEVKLFKAEVKASYYHDKFNGRKTANGELFYNSKLTAAHKRLPFGTRVLVTNPLNEKSVLVTINDRGPFIKGREIDLSKKAFMDISHSTLKGVLKVNLEIVQDTIQ